MTTRYAVVPDTRFRPRVTVYCTHDILDGPRRRVESLYVVDGRSVGIGTRGERVVRAAQPDFRAIAWRETAETSHVIRCKCGLTWSVRWERLITLLRALLATNGSDDVEVDLSAIVRANG